MSYRRNPALLVEIVQNLTENCLQVQNSVFKTDETLFQKSIIPQKYNRHVVP